MASSYVLDAHALIWYIDDNPRLGKEAGRIMDDPSSILYLPISALAEACWVVEKGRCTIPSIADLLAEIDADPRITTVPLDRAIVELSNTLTAIGEMHDRQITATTLQLRTAGHNVSLLTRDENITTPGLVPVVW
jgi:PIN domain nuclease of toxin-antitoxin system